MNPVVRLSRRQWIGYDPGERIVVIAFGDRDGLWQVRPEDGIEEHLDSDLRAAVAMACEVGDDEPWVIDLAGVVEHDLTDPGWP